MGPRNLKPSDLVGCTITGTVQEVDGKRKLVNARLQPPPQPIRPEVLLEFVRALVRNTCGGDVISLSLMQAKRKASATEEEMAALVAAVKQTRHDQPWPSGFMPEDDF